MRPTDLKFRDPRERTPPPYSLKSVWNSNRVGTIGKQARFGEYKQLEKRTTNRVGPGAYRDHYNTVRAKRVPTPLYKNQVKKTGSEAYYFIGNHIIYDEAYAQVMPVRKNRQFENLESCKDHHIQHSYSNYMTRSDKSFWESKIFEKSCESFREFGEQKKKKIRQKTLKAGSLTKRSKNLEQQLLEWEFEKSNMYGTQRQKQKPKILKQKKDNKLAKKIKRPQSCLPRANEIIPLIVIDQNGKMVDIMKIDSYAISQRKEKSLSQVKNDKIGSSRQDTKSDVTEKQFCS